MTNIASFTGWSGSGKTTLIVGLVKILTARGRSVAVIKHTHHELNELRQGDSERFLTAGASTVALANDREAVVFHGDQTTRIQFANADSLLAHLSEEIILIEGFKNAGSWPRIELHEERWLDPAQVVLELDRIWAGP